MLRNLKREGIPQLSRPQIAIAGLATLLIGGVGVYAMQQTPTQLAPIATTQVVPEIITVTALGRLEPKGEVIKLSAPTSVQGSRVDKLLVEQGDGVKAGQVIAIMENRDRLQASLKEAQQKVMIAEARLAQVKAGAKQGELVAKSADISRLEAELRGDMQTQQAEIARLEAQLAGEGDAQTATIKRLEAELQGQRNLLKATVNRIAAEKRNAQANVARYENLYKEGVISSQEVDARRLSAETITQQLLETQANQNRTIATLEEQINEARANRNKTISTVEQQIKAAQANYSKTIASRRQQIEQAQGNLNQTAEIRPTDIIAAQAEIDSAKASVERIQAELNLAYIRAPQTGRILKINTRAGEIVGNNGIVEFGQTSQMYAIAEVYQSDISKIKPGQQVEVTSDAIPDKLQGKVELVGNQIERQNIINSDPSSNLDARVVEVRISLDEVSSKKAAKFTNLQVKTVIKI